MIKYNPDLPLFSLHIPKCAGTSFNNILEKWYTDNGCLWNIQNKPRVQKYFSSILKFGIPQLLKGDRLLRHYKPQTINFPPQYYNLKTIKKLTKKPICVHGHFDKNNDGANFFYKYEEAKQFITVLRDPLEMQLSLFHYNKNLIEKNKLIWQGRRVDDIEFGGDINKWVANRKLYLLDFIPFDINVSNYKKVINDYFIHIGITEELQKSIDIFAKKLGFKPLKVPTLNKAERNESPSAEAIEIFKSKHKLEYLIYNFAKEQIL